MPELKLPELIVILVILLLLFGSKRLPALSKSIGESIRELRGGSEKHPKQESSSEVQPNSKTDSSNDTNN